MIIDSIKNSSLYENINPLFPKAFEYIRNLNFESIEEGKIEIDGLKLFVGINSVDLKSKEEAKLEAHNKYIDIQIPISKEETFGWAPREELSQPLSDFDTEKDIQFFDDSPRSFFNLSPTHFVIFFPHDAHAPCIGDGKTKKIVVKIRI